MTFIAGGNGVSGLTQALVLAMSASHQHWNEIHILEASYTSCAGMA